MKRKRAFYDNPGIRRAAERKAARKIAVREPIPIEVTAQPPVAAPQSKPGLSLRRIIPPLALAAALLLPLLRLAQVIRWPWVAVLAPFTIAGFYLVVVYVITILGHRFAGIARAVSRRQCWRFPDTSSGLTARPACQR